MSGGLQYLQDMLDNLSDEPDGPPPFYAVVASRPTRSTVTYDVVGGWCESQSLLNIPEVAVARTRFSAHTTFPEHTHEEKEVIMVYKGRGIMSYPGGEVELGPGDVVIFEPGQPHSFRTLEPTEIIAQTIPAGRGFPGERDES